MKAAPGEARRHARESERRLEELLAQRRAGAGVVAGASVRHVVTEGLVGDVLAGEPGRLDRAVADQIAAGVLLRHDETERVAFAQAEKVDVPLEHVDELLHELRTFTRAADGLVQRAVDRRRDRRLDLADFRLRRRHVELAAGVAHRADVAPARHLHLHRIDVAARVVVEADQMARAEAPDVERLRQLARQQRAFRARETAGDEHAVERVVLFDGEDQRVLGESCAERLQQVVVADFGWEQTRGHSDRAEFRLRSHRGEEERNGEREG
jgi:hypothetical protein